MPDNSFDFKPKKTIDYKKLNMLLIIVIILLLIAVGLLAYLLFSKNDDVKSSNIINTSTTVTSTVMSTVTPTTTTSSSQITVNVYFSKNGDDTNVYSVNRTTDRSDVATFVMEQYLAGPTTSEISQGYKNNVALSGVSSCNGKDFTINIVSGKATFKFCKTAPLSGVLSDALLKKSLESNLMQFSTIQSVVLLNKDGNCLIDYKGDNQCNQ